MKVCRIKERHYDESTDLYSYDVELGESLKSLTESEENIPHYAIRFVDKPYKSDQWLFDAFRHPIMFPENMTPLKWKTKS